MAKVIWSPLARENLKAIHDYISADSPDRAGVFIRKLITATDRLQDWPESGRVIPEINELNCREVIVRPYRIMYRIRETKC